MEHSGAYFLGALAPFIHISKKSYHIQPYIWILLLPDAWTIFVFKVPWNTTLLFVLVSVSMNSQGQETPAREKDCERESQHRFEGSSNPDTLSGKDTISAVTGPTSVSIRTSEGSVWFEGATKYTNGHRERRECTYLNHFREEHAVLASPQSTSTDTVGLAASENVVSGLLTTLCECIRGAGVNLV